MIATTISRENDFPLVFSVGSRVNQDQESAAIVSPHSPDRRLDGGQSHAPNHCPSFVNDVGNRDLVCLSVFIVPYNTRLQHRCASMFSVFEERGRVKPQDERGRTMMGLIDVGRDNKMGIMLIRR